MRSSRTWTMLAFGLAFLSARPAVAFHCQGGTLIGGGGDDTFTGSGCDDVIVGNDGDNDLTGLRGHDLFVFSTGYCRGLEWQAGWVQIVAPSSPDCSPAPIPFFPSFGISEVNDFTRGFDRITLDKATFRALQSQIGLGLSDLTDFHVVDSDAAVDADPAVIVYSVESEMLFYNENGPAAGLGQASPFAHLPDVASLAPSDFQVLDWTPSPVTTTTTITATTQTTTTLPLCGTPSCVLDRAFQGPACVHETIPNKLLVLSRRASTLVAAAGRATGHMQKRPLKQAAAVLKKLAKQAQKSAAGKPPKISAACAKSIFGAAGTAGDLFTR